jgi:transposase-like protein
VWLYYRFNLSYRDVEDLLAERDITVSREAIRQWCNKFGPQYAKRWKRRHQGYGESQYANNLAELSHQPTRVRERGMRGAASRRFKPMHQAHRFLGVHAAVYNLFNLGRHLVSANHYRSLRQGAFVSWEKAVAV